MCVRNEYVIIHYRTLNIHRKEYITITRKIYLSIQRFTFLSNPIFTLQRKDYQNISNFPFSLPFNLILSVVTILTDLPRFLLSFTVEGTFFNRTVKKRNLKLFAFSLPQYVDVLSFFHMYGIQRGREREREGDSVALWWPVAEVVVKLVRSRLCHSRKRNESTGDRWRE